MNPRQDASLENLLEFVKTTRGFDFTGYKRASIERRVRKRMGDIGTERFDDYIDHLELHAEEFAELFNTLLINVTGFFRDPQTWEHLAEVVIPQLVERRGAGAPLRVWCAGCASGEEAYSIAMVIARVIGEERFRDNVKVYATDVDEEALETARHGAYLPRHVEDVPREALERFFERSDQRYVFRKDLRRSVIFGRNDLIQDAPISRIDLLVCRNTLMYFTADTQAHILRRFHFALNDDGVLLLGKSEMLITHSDLFTPADLKWRVFRKVVKPVQRDRVRVVAVDPGNGASLSVAENLREAAFDAGARPQIVLDADRTLVMANSASRRLFKLNATDLGRPVQDLEPSYRPLELRGHLDAMEREPRTIEISSVRWETGGQNRLFAVRLAPLQADGALLGVSIIYDDQTELGELRDEADTAKRELEHAYEELQSTVEELETTNEELQSTNEELETMNDELRHRTLEVNDMNDFLESILTTVGVAVAGLDDRQHVQIWNGQARDLWGLGADEASGRDWFSLDIGLPVEQLRDPIRDCQAGRSAREETVLEAVNRRGRAFRCRVICLPMRDAEDGEVTGVNVMMEALAD
jgi:two-component system CheB/CheR fusion protein